MGIAKRDSSCESSVFSMKTSSSTLLSSFVTSSSSTTIPGITGGERGGERGGRRRKVSIFICLLCILFLCVVFTYRASTFSPSQDDDVGGRVVGIGGRDDGDDDVTKNTYENADDAMRIGAKEENVEATATPSAEESFREEEEEEQEEKTEDSKRGASRTEDEEE